MLDLKWIRENPDLLLAALRRRHADDLIPEVERLLALDAQWREATVAYDTLRHEQNQVSKQIGVLKREKQDASDVIARMGQVAQELRAREEQVRQSRSEIDAILMVLPNVPHDSVPDGASAEDNPVVKTWGDVPSFSFEPKPHWDLGEQLGIIDLPRGSKLSGSGFPLYRGLGAKLQRSLVHLMLDIHTTEHGYTEFSPPFIVTRATMTGTGQLPKFEDELYRLARQGMDTDDIEGTAGAIAGDAFLIPTAEVPVTNIHSGEILDGSVLPLYYTAHTPCFRREAGAAGKDTRGILRVHQFEKVELVKVTSPDTSYDELGKMLADAERIVQRLELPYRVITLCTGDMGFQSAKTYDIEVWAAGQGRWLEVSSISNCTDFQSRRAEIRFRREEGERAELVHTLNGSGLALPRIVIALLENNQCEDGSVRLPKALQPYMGVERIAS
ncbi:serine--tRNA ligase [Candidatus Poribacteria bacterium]|nr:serine--tRNA ligase [Candidatus Poribacteria bacterium]